MNKYKVSYHIKGAVHRPAYDGETTVWVNEPHEINRAVYDKIKQTFFDIFPSDVVVTRMEYLTNIFGGTK